MDKHLRCDIRVNCSSLPPQLYRDLRRFLESHAEVERVELRSRIPDSIVAANAGLVFPGFDLAVYPIESAVVSLGPEGVAKLLQKWIDAWVVQNRPRNSPAVAQAEIHVFRRDETP
jgi:hypothetical protein